MLRIVEILDKSNYKLTCKFNNGEVRQIDIVPVIENHKHLNGVASILNENIFQSAQIGELGEVLWPKIVKIDTECWDYDISPEYAYYHSSKA